MTLERKFVRENIKRVLLKEKLQRETSRAGFGGLDIQRTPHGLRLTLTAERPRFVIGRRGSTIKRLTQEIKDEFDLDNPQIEVKDSEQPSLNSQIMAQKLSSALERGWHFRRAGHTTLRRIMEAEAKGCLIIISGKLTGQRHRTEKFGAGHIKFCGDTALQWIDRGFAIAKKKLGVIGVKVLIMNKDAKLPDEVEIADPSEDKGLQRVDWETSTTPADEEASEKKIDEALEEISAESAESVEPVEHAEPETKKKIKKPKKTAKKAKKEGESKEKPAEESGTTSESEKKDVKETPAEEKVEAKAVE